MLAFKFRLRSGPAAARVTLAALCAPLAHAGDDAPEPPTESRYVIGASLAIQPDYPGSDRQVTKLRPLWAYQYGRFRISTSRASSVLGFASDAVGPGASAELLNSRRWRVGVALRFDSGRPSADSPTLAGLPEVKRTLRGRFYTSYEISPHWNLNGTVSQDLIGRHGGALASLDLGYHRRFDERSEFSSGGGLSFGNTRYMTTYFGVPDSAALPDRPAFSPGGGPRDIHFGLGVMTAFTPRWIGFANAGVSRLLQDAAGSPLTRQATSGAVSFGLAWRCCRP